MANSIEVEADYQLKLAARGVDQGPVAQRFPEVGTYQGTLNFRLPAEPDTSSVIKDVEKVQVRAAGNGLPTIEEQQEKRTLFTYSEGQRILRKIDWYLLPILMFAYMIKAMDSAAISYVKTMNSGTKYNIIKELHMTTNDYSYTSTVFTVFVALGEVPSNLFFKKAGPRMHYTRIIVLWSIAAACQAASFNKAGILTSRAFLGIFEAGLAPGIWLHLTYWYRPDEVGPRMAIISALYQFANIFNAFLSYGFSFVSGHNPLAGWRWVFIVEGLVGLVCAIIIYLWVPTYPDEAPFLTQEEREWVVGRLPSLAARKTDVDFSWAEVKDAILDRTTLMFSISLMLFQSGLLGYLFWLPSIVASFGISSTATVQLLTIPPAFLYWVGGIFGSWVNDRATSIPRFLMFNFACSIWIGLLCALAFVRNKAGLYVIMCFASIFAAWAFNTWMPWRAQSLRGASHAATTLSFLNGAGQVPGVYTGQIFRSQYAPRYTIAFMCCVALTGASMVGATILGYLTRREDSETRRISALRRKVGKESDRILEEDVEFDEAVTKRNNH
ncbi:MFS general substrate transporter [Meredithblackwellia eburnea MCA 4105]